MAIAFFDFDRTLVTANTANLWLKSMWQQGKLSPRQAAASFGWLLCYNFGFAPLESGMHKAISLLKGQKKELFVSQVKNFYDTQVCNLYRPGGLKAVQEHRSKGDKVVLLTTSINHLSDLVVQDLKLDHGIATVLEIDANDCYTGNIVGPLCFGNGKVTEAEKYAQLYGIKLKDCTFYSDSMSDLPMLQAVGRAVAVSPDPRLKRQAAHRNWPIVSWE